MPSKRKKKKEKRLTLNRTSNFTPQSVANVKKEQTLEEELFGALPEITKKKLPQTPVKIPANNSPQIKSDVQTASPHLLQSTKLTAQGTIKESPLSKPASTKSNISSAPLLNSSAKTTIGNANQTTASQRKVVKEDKTHTRAKTDAQLATNKDTQTKRPLEQSVHNQNESPKKQKTQNATTDAAQQSIAPPLSQPNINDNSVSINADKQVTPPASATINETITTPTNLIAEQIKQEQKPQAIQLSEEQFSEWSYQAVESYTKENFKDLGSVLMLQKAIDIFSNEPQPLSIFLHIRVESLDAFTNYIKINVIPDKNPDDYFTVSRLNKKIIIKNRELIGELITFHAEKIIENANKQQINLSVKSEPSTIASTIPTTGTTTQVIKSAVPEITPPINQSDMMQATTLIQQSNGAATTLLSSNNNASDIAAPSKKRQTQLLDIGQLPASHKKKKTEKTAKSETAVIYELFASNLINGIMKAEKDKPFNLDFLFAILQQTLIKCTTIKQIECALQIYSHFKSQGWQFMLSPPKGANKGEIFTVKHKHKSSNTSTTYSLVFNLDFISGNANKGGILEGHKKVTTHLFDPAYVIDFTLLESNLKALFNQNDFRSFINVKCIGNLKKNQRDYPYNEIDIRITNLSEMLQFSNNNLKLISISSIYSANQNQQQLIQEFSNFQLTTLQNNLSNEADLANSSPACQAFAKDVTSEIQARKAKKAEQMKKQLELQAKQKQEEAKKRIVQFEAIKNNIMAIRNVECDLYNIIISYYPQLQLPGTLQKMVENARSKFPVDILASIFPNSFNGSDFLCGITTMPTDFMFKLIKCAVPTTPNSIPKPIEKDYISLNYLLANYTQKGGVPVNSFEATNIVTQRMDSNNPIRSPKANTFKLQELDIIPVRDLEEHDLICANLLELLQKGDYKEDLTREALDSINRIRELANKYSHLIINAKCKEILDRLTIIESGLERPEQKVTQPIRNNTATHAPLSQEMRPPVGLSTQSLPVTRSPQTIPQQRTTQPHPGNHIVATNNNWPGFFPPAPINQNGYNTSTAQRPGNNNAQPTQQVPPILHGLMGLNRGPK